MMLSVGGDHRRWKGILQEEKTMFLMIIFSGKSRGQVALEERNVLRIDLRSHFSRAWYYLFRFTQEKLGEESGLFSVDGIESLAAGQSRATASGFAQGVGRSGW